METDEDASGVPRWHLWAARILDVLHFPLFFLFTIGWVSLWGWIYPPRVEHASTILWWAAGTMVPLLIILCLQFACRGCPITFAAARLRGEPSPSNGWVARIYQRFGPVYASGIIASSLFVPMVGLVLLQLACRNG